MIVRSDYRLVIAALSSIALAQPSAQALDIGKANPLKWFKGKEESVPSISEKQAQEAEAQAMYRDAKTAISTGSTGRAQSILKDIVSRYRFTETAGDAQFEYANLVKQEGKLQAAFDAYQKLVDDYRHSPHFDTALKEQFQIAEESRGGRKQGGLLFIPMKMDRGAIIKLYQGIITNSPYGKYAPYAQFAIGEIYQDAGDKSNANIAFQAVVDNFPNAPLASEAQFRIGAIASAAANRTQDVSNLTTTRDALEMYRATNPEGDRRNEVDSILNQVTESQANQSLQTGKFYENSGKIKAAAIYYNEAIQYGSVDSSTEARERLANLATLYPEEVKESTAINKSATTIQANADLKGRKEYAGPPGPFRPTPGGAASPEMRVEQDDFRPIPLQEPELPTRPTTQPQPGMLLPPATDNAPSMNVPNLIQENEKPATPPAPAKPEEKKADTPPVPPAPAAAPATPPVPPAPAAPEAPKPEAEPSKPATPPAASSLPVPPAPPASN